MKKLTISLLLLLTITLTTIAWLSFHPKDQKFNAPVSHHPASETAVPRLSYRLKSKASAARLYAEKNQYNEDFCFLIDMSLSSGSNRFFVFDFAKDSIRSSGLVTHGRCNEDWLEGRKYNNTIGGGCTSLGKYKIGYAYHGRFGLAFKLYGLEKTNSNAFARYVVLHAHECVPESVVSDEICQSVGCPTVSPGFLKILEPLIRNSPKPVLLWIYE